MPKYKCCNPFKIESHRVRNPCFPRKLTNDNLKQMKMDGINPDCEYICHTCRKKLARGKRLKKVTEAASTSVEQSTLKERHECYSDILSTSSGKSNSTAIIDNPDSPIAQVAIATLNDTLRTLGRSPIKENKLCRKTYPKRKFREVTDIIGTKVFNVSYQFDEEQQRVQQKYNELMQNLKNAYEATDDNHLKVSILTLFSNWTFADIQSQFNATNHMIRVSRKVQKEKGFLAGPNPKIGRCIDTELVSLVENFFESEEISRTMPGMKDCRSVYKNGKKLKVQKHLVLCNLKEAHVAFKEKYNDIKISFSKFAALRPGNCILAEASRTHTVCVCETHQNVKLMLEGGRIPKISELMKNRIKTYRDCFKEITCNPARAQCFMKKCKKCPEITAFRKKLQSAYQEAIIDTVVYKQ